MFAEQIIESISECLQVNTLTASYDGPPVIQNISFSLPMGRLVGVLGPNGAGKSTLIKAILALMPRQAGQVSFWGKPLKLVRNRIAYVPQRSSVEWDFPATVKDVVLMGRYGRLGLFHRPKKEDRAIALSALERVGMADFADRQISNLSGGQQQRVFLARALAQEADLYFLDEPFAGVDATSESVIIGLLRQLRDQGKTIVVVHHDLSTAKDYFDDLVMVNKQLMAYGPSHQVFNPAELKKTYGEYLATFQENGNVYMLEAYRQKSKS